MSHFDLCVRILKAALTEIPVASRRDKDWLYKLDVEKLPNASRMLTAAESGAQIARALRHMKPGVFRIPKRMLADINEQIAGNPDEFASIGACEVEHNRVVIYKEGD